MINQRLSPVRQILDMAATRAALRFTPRAAPEISITVTVGLGESAILVGMEPGSQGESTAEGPVASALDWAFDASRLLRSRTTRRLRTTIEVPLDRTPGSAETLGGLIRPLLVEFEPNPALRPYQEEGVAFLRAGGARILADDMGLGKTIQVVEATRLLVAQGKIRGCLVVAPKTLVAVWRRELERWGHGLTFRTTPSLDQDDFISFIRGLGVDCHVGITHYEALRTQLARHDEVPPVDLLVLDEAHRVRRSSAGVTTQIRRIPALRRWALTGTPIERAPEDLSTLLSLLEPHRIPGDVHSYGTHALRSMAKPLLLRRLKADVLAELPPVSEVMHDIELSDRQRTSYTERLRTYRSSLAGGDLLALIGDLLTICDLDPESRESAKLDAIVELTIGAASEGEKVVIFSHRLAPLRSLEGRLAPLKPLLLEGSMPATERERTISSFSSDGARAVLLASSRVASEGLTLTVANHAIFVNRWWNPSANDQARDRLVRIGQERPVFVHSFTCADTIEERLSTILEEKREIFREVVDALGYGRAIKRQRQVARSLGLDIQR